MENRHKTIVLSRYRFESLQTRKLSLKGLVIPKCFPLNDLNRAISAQDVSGQPDLAIAATANTAQ